MKQYLLLILFVFSFLSAQAQKDTANYSSKASARQSLSEAVEVNINIFPVPVRDNSFTIKSDKEISAIRITNIIGQDIYRVKYNTPQLLAKILLENPKRGMYLVTLGFSDDTRVVRKIMIEGAY
jgi:hypothetical protein